MNRMIRTGTKAIPSITITPEPTSNPTVLTTYHSGYRCSVYIIPPVTPSRITSATLPFCNPINQKTIDRMGWRAIRRLYPSAKNTIPLIKTSSPLLASQITAIVNRKIITNSNRMLPASVVPSSPNARKTSKL